MAAIELFRLQHIKGWRRGVKLGLYQNGRQGSGNSRKVTFVRPDFVFRNGKIAVFIDGEFWHGHPTRARIPKTRTAWWRKKIEGNRARDRRQNRLLRKHGWTVVRIWQFELKTAAALRKLAKAGLMVLA